MSLALKQAARAVVACGVVAAVSVAGPAAAQESMGGQVFRTTVGATLLLPLGGPVPMSTSGNRPPSARVALEYQLNPRLGVHVGGLRLAPDIMWGPDTRYAGVDDPHEQVGLVAAVAGLRFNLLTGRVRLAPFVDAGVGQAHALVDRGGYFYQPLNDDGYAPALESTGSGMAGGGAGVSLEAILGPGITLGFMGGVWHFEPMGGSQDGVGIDPLDGAWGGVGIKLALRNETYYWRHSGRDRQPPVLAVVTPKPAQGGAIEVGKATARLTVRAADRSDIRSLEVAGQRVRLAAVAATAEEGRAAAGTVELTLGPGVNRVPFRAVDGAGNELKGTWEVLGVAPDREAPRIAVRQPSPDVTISTDRVQVEALIADRSPIRQVTLNGLTVSTTEASAEERAAVGAAPDEFVVRVQSTTTVPGASLDLVLAAVDTASNTQMETVTVHRSDVVVAQQAAPAPAPVVHRGPEIEIHAPAEWAGATRGFTARPKTSVRVAGLARYAEGVKEVLANGRRLAIQRDPANRSLVQFSGFVDPPAAGGSGRVQILARGLDGSQTVRTYTVAAAAAEPAASGPAAFGAIAGAENRQRWAVVIGVSDYADGAIGDLQYADDDARSVYDFLRSPAAGMGGIPDDHIRLLLNGDATARNIRSALTTFLRRSTPDDVIFLYIAAHGAPDPYRPDDLYLLATDTELDDIAATGVSMDDVNEAMQEAYAYNKVLVTDACHSAGVGSGTRALGSNQINAAFLDYMNSSSGGFVAFTASEANQLSQEGAQYGGGHGVFTYYFLQALQGQADEDGDHVVTLGEAMEFTRDRVRRATSNAQIPTISLTTYDRFWPMAAVLQR